ncbi:MAG: glycosyltransferase [Saprospiraceae bacterium]|nr:glycosyltransferase [Saprospiraceae bacterium]
MRTGTLSIILQSYESSAVLEHTADAILKHMDGEGIPVELIIVDDGSCDNSYQVAQALASSRPRVRAYRLARNYTTPYAQFAGMFLATGDCVVSVPDDLQRPLSVVVRMYRAWQQGHQIVIGYRETRSDGWLNDLFARWYYKLMNRLSDVRFPPGGADGFLADREVVDIINERISPVNTSTVVEVLRLGFDPHLIPYDRPKSDRKSRWSLRKKMRLALDTFFASSSFPIRMITILGFVMALISFIIIVLIVAAKLFSNNTLFGLPVQGWATSVVITVLFNGITLFALGIVAEYIWRIFEEVKGRPGYIIRKNDEEE